MSDLISVIIPVYNVENFITTCIDSLLSQTYRNIEILIVNDGSSDNTGSICDRYANEYQFIKIFHQVNAGVSSARNRGLEVFTGEWVFFLDGDDSLLPDAFDIALRFAKETECKIVDFNFVRIENNEVIHKNSFYRKNYVENSSQCMKGTLLYNRALIFPKLYHRTLVENLRFNTNLKIGEDLFFNIQLYLNPEFAIGHNATPIYLYLLRKGSAMQNERTYMEYTILNNEVCNSLDIYSQFQSELKLFCCINLYFKGIKERKAINSEMYNKYFALLTMSDCFINELAFKFKILFLAYKLNRYLGNLFLFLRYSFFAIH